MDRPFTSHDDSFHSNSDEETFSNLTRTKVEYLKLTPSEYVDDEVIDTVHIPDSYRQLLEDYKLKVVALISILYIIFIVHVMS